MRLELTCERFAGRSIGSDKRRLWLELIAWGKLLARGVLVVHEKATEAQNGTLADR